ncbi:hypothetical protein LXL04_032875 [Taraxacum kok-saghyz]
MLNREDEVSGGGSKHGRGARLLSVNLKSSPLANPPLVRISSTSLSLCITLDLAGTYVPFQVELEVNVVLIGFSGDGGYRYTLDSQKLKEFLQVNFPTDRPSSLEIGEPLDIEHHMVFNTIQ